MSGRENGKNVEGGREEGRKGLHSKAFWMGKQSYSRESYGAPQQSASVEKLNGMRYDPLGG